MKPLGEGKNAVGQIFFHWISLVHNRYKREFSFDNFLRVFVAILSMPFLRKLRLVRPEVTTQQFVKADVVFFWSAASKVIEGKQSFIRR